MTQKGEDKSTLINTIIDGIEDVKGNNITVLDLTDLDNTVCSHFIICDGTSNTQVRAIVNSVRKKVSKAHQEKPWQTEGEDNAEWVLIDYVDIVVHVFQKHTREHYDLEGLWGDAVITEVQTA